MALGADRAKVRTNQGVVVVASCSEQATIMTVFCCQFCIVLDSGPTEPLWTSWSTAETLGTSRITNEPASLRSVRDVRPYTVSVRQSRALHASSWSSRDESEEYSRSTPSTPIPSGGNGSAGKDPSHRRDATRRAGAARLSGRTDST